MVLDYRFTDAYVHERVTCDHTLPPCILPFRSFFPPKKTPDRRLMNGWQLARSNSKSRPAIWREGSRG